MRLIIKSKFGILDQDFINHLINYMPVLLVKEKLINKKKLKHIDEYLFKNIFIEKRKFTAEQIIIMGIRNFKSNVDSYTAVIEINPASIFPFYDFKIKDICNLIEDGNLDIKGTKAFHNLFEYIKININDLRIDYEKGLF